MSNNEASQNPISETDKKIILQEIQMDEKESSKNQAKNIEPKKN